VKLTLGNVVWDVVDGYCPSFNDGQSRLCYFLKAFIILPCIAQGWLELGLFVLVGF